MEVIKIFKIFNLFKVFKIIKRKINPLWGTKPFDVWLALNVVLQLSTPRNILEFGGGKSTRYLAEYSKASGAHLLTIEENPLWFKKIKSNLKRDQLRPDVVSLVPLVHNWYDLKKVESLTKDIFWDFLLIDGPAQLVRRDSSSGTKYLEALSRSSKTIIIDDLHEHKNMVRFHSLIKNRKEMNVFFMAYDVGSKGLNLIGFMCEAQIIEKTLATLSMLEIEFIKNYETASELVWLY